MALSCYHASLACAGALVAVELAAALGLRPAAALAAARLLLVCVWLRCWSGAPDGASGFPSAKGGAWTPCASAAAERALVRSAADAPGRPRTWRSAGVPLPRPELVMNLIKSRR